jgi:hypothetical protein
MEITRVWEEEGGHASPAAIECKHVGVCVQGRWTRRSMLPMLAQCDATRAFVCLRTRTSTHNTADFAGGRSDAVETRADLDRKRFLRHHVSRHACINTHTHTHTHTHTRLRIRVDEAPFHTEASDKHWHPMLVLRDKLDKEKGRKRGSMIAGCTAHVPHAPHAPFRV